MEEYIIQSDNVVTMAKTIDNVLDKISENVTIDNYKSFKVFEINNNNIVKYIFNDDASLMITDNNNKTNIKTTEINQKLFPTSHSKNSKKYLVIDNENNCTSLTKNELSNYITCDNYSELKIIELGTNIVYYYNAKKFKYISNTNNILDIGLQNIIDNYEMKIAYYENYILRNQIFECGMIKNNSDNDEPKRLNAFLLKIGDHVRNFIKTTGIVSVTIFKNNEKISGVKPDGLYYKDTLLYHKSKLVNTYKIVCNKLAEYEQSKLMEMSQPQIMDLINKKVQELVGDTKEDMIDFLHKLEDM